MPPLPGQVQRCGVERPRHVHLGAPVQKVPGHLHVAATSCMVQGREAQSILAIHLGTPGSQQLGSQQVSIGSCPV